MSRRLRVLFVSKELIAGDLAYQLKNEECEVKLCIENGGDKDCFNGMVEKTQDWKKELGWVGKDGLIVFDDVGYGTEQDSLRREGYLVIGGSGDGDRLELDRKYGQKVMRTCGFGMDDDFETKSFTVKSAIDFIKKRKGRWVLKQDNHDEALTCVGEMDDGSDVLEVLENYRVHLGESYRVSLQRKVCGVEIAIGRFFNGNTWIGPLVFNIEHKHLCNDDIGPLGGETGTLMWYEKNSNKRLFQETLAKLEPHLRKSSYKGYVDVNCIVSDKDTVYPLEITSRFGSSTNEMQSEIHISPWSEFLLAMAKGKDYELQYKKGYGVNVAVTVPPFPYRTSDSSLSQKGVNIFFKKDMSQEELSHVHFEEVMIEKNRDSEQYRIAGSTGYVLYVTSVEKTIQKAREKIYGIIGKIIIPKMFYRTDIGLRFVKNDRKLLKEWNWI
ncbi:MAG: hypothetical protein HGB08_02350 [Candidatus Moranbacteria bacterium]|nr:hypothetical protein [Candidatus Moranbacteria bacterium]